ncbi:MAG TPA: hypothetical protein VIC06_14215 [Solirubrobacteraceae bacterium]|jgi:hypothetical protein
MVDTVSASLPDGRAWEMVSPLNKDGGDIVGIAGDSGGGVVQAAANGQQVTYVSLASFGAPQGAPIGSQYVGRRDGEARWSNQNISMPMSAQSFPPGAGLGTPFRAFSSDLSSGLVWGGPRGPRGIFEGPPLAGGPAEYENYYLTGLPGGTLQPLLARAPSMPAAEFQLEFLGATPDLKRAVIESPAVLGTGGIEVNGGHNLYEWEPAAGQYQPINVLPSGAYESEKVLFGGAGGARSHAISEDGSRVVWTAESAPSALYVREGIGTPQPVTVQADAPAGGGRFLTASSDDSRVFFADNHKLTADSTAGNGGLGDLYRFEPDGSMASRLVDLTIDHVDPEGAEVLGVLGGSSDGSYLYFVANGVLSSDPGISRGNCTPGSSPAGATCNLYLWHEGWATPRFIAKLSGGDEFEEAGFAALGAAFDWAPSIDVRTTRVSHDGNRVVFMSEASLTGYDNTVRAGNSCRKNFAGGPALPAQCEEVFVYEASTNHLNCVSCNPSGARPIGPSGIPGGTQISTNFALYQSRVLSEEDVGNAGGGASEEGGGAGEAGPGDVGTRVFFDSADDLGAGDTNGVEDVYEYENGHVYLISDGSSAGGSSFVDAGGNGNDVFFITRAQLVAQDTDQLVDLYDARAPHVPGEMVGASVTSSSACAGEDCRMPSPVAPALGTPASALFVGSGNAVALPAPATHPKPKAKKKKSKRSRKKGKSRKGKTRGKSKRHRALRAAGTAGAAAGRSGRGAS